jgi:light-regulated signal transduction histidine kinase (bacteriophytochrome)
LLSVVMLRDSEGNPLCMIASTRDITERKQAEQALAEKTEDLQRSNEELERFAYVASHDFQEPLRMVSSYVQLLARRYQGRLDADADVFIGFAVDGAKRMQNLINDFLVYRRVDRRGEPQEPTDFETVCRKAKSSLQKLITESNATITHDPLPTVMADHAQMVQVFQNLIGNAIKFRGEAPPSLHISARKSRNEWVFAFRDNGMGIAKEFFERIFIIFQRLQLREEYPGTGMGLAICKRIMERHGGRVWVESEPGRGATFYFTLPVREDNGVS